MPTIHEIIRSNLHFLDIPEVKPVHLWAKDHRMMSGAVTAKPGMYSTDITPYAIEPGLSFDDPEVMTTVMCWASRLGKTEIVMNLEGRTIHVDPKNMLVGYPTLDAAKKWSKEFFNPMIESSHCFKGLISDPAKRDGENTILSKRFPGGRISAIGANSPSSFRQIQAPIVILDEIDAMEATKEGDPVTLAFKRADNYSDSIQVLLSTPTIKGLSRIWKALEGSDWRQWFVPSPYTGKFHVLSWDNMHWDKDASGKGLPETATYLDPDTGEEWTEAQRQAAIMAGEWRATQPFTGVRGYHLNGMNSLFAPKKGFKNKYHQMVSDFLDAKHKGSEELQVWTNTFLAECWEDQTATEIDGAEVMNRIDNYDTNPVPDRVLVLTFAADVQMDRIEFEWVGWCDDFESYGLRYGVISGDTRRPEIWKKLETEIRRTWKHPSGGEMRMRQGFIDEGHNAQMVRKFCLSQLKQGIDLYPCKGKGNAGLNEPELVSFNAQKTQKGIKAPTWTIGTNRAKRAIFNHLLLDPPGAHTMNFTDKEGAGYTANYFEMLTAEKEVTKYSMGQEYRAFVKKKSGGRNEALDIRAYGYACAVSLNPDWDGLRKLISRKQPKEQTMEEKLQPEKEKPMNPTMQKRPKKRGKRGGGFVGRY